MLCVHSFALVLLVAFSASGLKIFASATRATPGAALGGGDRAPGETGIGGSGGRSGPDLRTLLALAGTASSNESAEIRESIRRFVWHRSGRHCSHKLVSMRQMACRLHDALHRAHMLDIIESPPTGITKKCLSMIWCHFWSLSYISHIECPVDMYWKDFFCYSSEVFKKFTDN